METGLCKCQSDTPIQKNQEEGNGDADTNDDTRLCSCGNQASPIEHEGIYCSVLCAQTDAHGTLIHGDGTSHYRRIQRTGRRSVSPFESEGMKAKGCVTSESDTSKLHDHGYMSTEEWAPAFETLEVDAGPSDITKIAQTNGWAQAGQIARKQRVKKRKMQTDPPESEALEDKDSTQTEAKVCPRSPERQYVPLLSSPSPKRPRGKAVHNIRPVLTP